VAGGAHSRARAHPGAKPGPGVHLLGKDAAAFARMGARRVRVVPNAIPPLPAPLVGAAPRRGVRRIAGLASECGRGRPAGEGDLASVPRAPARGAAGDRRPQPAAGDPGARLPGRAGRRQRSFRAALPGSRILHRHSPARRLRDPHQDPRGLGGRGSGGREPDRRQKGSPTPMERTWSWRRSLASSRARWSGSGATSSWQRASRKRVDAPSSRSPPRKWAKRWRERLPGAARSGGARACTTRRTLRPWRRRRKRGRAPPRAPRSRARSRGPGDGVRASESARGSPGGTSTPAPPSSRSGSSPTALATTQRPVPALPAPVSGSPSVSDGKAMTSAAAKTSRGSSRYPRQARIQLASESWRSARIGPSSCEEQVAPRPRAASNSTRLSLLRRQPPDQRDRIRVRLKAPACRAPTPASDPEIGSGGGRPLGHEGDGRRADPAPQLPLQRARDLPHTPGEVSQHSRDAFVEANGDGRPGCRHETSRPRARRGQPPATRATNRALKSCACNSRSPAPAQPGPRPRAADSRCASHFRIATARGPRRRASSSSPPPSGPRDGADDGR